MTSRSLGFTAFLLLALSAVVPAAGVIPPFQLGDYNRGRTSVFDASGGVVVAWEEADGIAVRRFDAEGKPRDEQGVVSGTPRSHPSLAPLAGGGFALASRGPDGSGMGLFLLLFDADGQPLGPERRVSAPLGGDQIGGLHPLPPGGFLAAWTSPAPRPLGKAFDLCSPRGRERRREDADSPGCTAIPGAGAALRPGAGPEISSRSWPPGRTSVS